MLLKRPPHFGPILRAIRQQVTPEINEMLVEAERGGAGCLGWLYHDRADDGTPLQSTCPRDGERAELCPVRRFCRMAWDVGEQFVRNRGPDAPEHAPDEAPLRAAAVAARDGVPPQAPAAANRTPEEELALLRERLFVRRGARARTDYRPRGLFADEILAAFLDALGHPPVVGGRWAETAAFQAQVRARMGPLVCLAPASYHSVLVWQDAGGPNGAGHFLKALRFWTNWHARVRADVIPEVRAAIQRAGEKLLVMPVPEKSQRKFRMARDRVEIRTTYEARHLAEVVLRFYGIAREDNATWGATARAVGALDDPPPQEGSHGTEEVDAAHAQDPIASGSDQGHTTGQ